MFWSPVVYRAISVAAHLDGVPAPRHLPGWRALALIASLGGGSANLIAGTHMAAVVVTPFLILVVAGYYYVPARLRHGRAKRAEREQLRRELRE
ncbi:MAG TPA: hypothetical protein VF483_13445 [Gemmatimonadaceae bacterium]